MERNGRETCKSKAERFLRRLLLVMTGLLLIAVAGAALLADYRERAAEADEFREFALLAATPSEGTTPQTAPAPATLTEATASSTNPEPTAEVPKNAQILSRFTEMYAQNSDLGGWVKIDDTDLDYPVMFTPDEPERYIHLAFSKKKSMSGVPFVGEGCTIWPRSDNIVLYGHHMKSGAMFASIVKYKDKDFWREHPIIH
ncbi:MAG: class B sortase, partial [Christensenella sp.]|nr:class B sortase [Christensenella sp.]